MIEMQQPFSFPPYAFHVKRKKASLIPSAKVSTHFHSSVRGPAISVTLLPLVLLSPQHLISAWGRIIHGFRR